MFCSTLKTRNSYRITLHLLIYATCILIQCIHEYAATSAATPATANKKTMVYGAQARIEMTILFLYSQTS